MCLEFTLSTEGYLLICSLKFSFFSVSPAKNLAVICERLYDFYHKTSAGT